MSILSPVFIWWYYYVIRTPQSTQLQMTHSHTQSYPRRISRPRSWIRTNIQTKDRTKTETKNETRPGSWTESRPRPKVTKTKQRFIYSCTPIQYKITISLYLQSNTVQDNDFPIPVIQHIQDNDHYPIPAIQHSTR